MSGVRDAVERLVWLHNAVFSVTPGKSPPTRCRRADSSTLRRSGASVRRAARARRRARHANRCACRTPSRALVPGSRCMGARCKSWPSSYARRHPCLRGPGLFCAVVVLKTLFGAFFWMNTVALKGALLFFTIRNVSYSFRRTRRFIARPGTFLSAEDMRPRRRARTSRSCSWGCRSPYRCR